MVLLRTSFALSALLTSAVAQTGTTTTTTTSTKSSSFSATKNPAVEDTRGPPGRRHNFWWWLALGVSGVLILFLFFLLLLSWCCCARHRHRTRTTEHRHGHHGGGPSDKALSTSPDNYTTRRGSRDAGDEAHQRGEAAVTVSNYVNKVRPIGQIGNDVDALEGQAIDGDVRHERKRVFLAGGGGGDRKRSKKASPSRKRSVQARSPTPPRVATWTNKPRSVTPPVRSTATPAAAPAPLLLERLPSVDAEMPNDVSASNPLSVAGAQRAEKVEESLLTRTPAISTTAAGAVAADADDRIEDVEVDASVSSTTAKPMMTSVKKEAVEMPVFMVSPNPSQPTRSPEQEAVDVPITGIDQSDPRHRHHASASFSPRTGSPQPHQHQDQRQQQQLQVAKSPTRASLKAQNITAAEATPSAAITGGLSKQYFFGYQRNPAQGKSTAAAAPAQPSPEAQPLREHQPSPTPSQHQPQQQPDVAATQRQQASLRQSPISLILDSHVRSHRELEGSARPSSATPYTSYVFSPLHMTGLEPEAGPSCRDSAGAPTALDSGDVNVAARTNAAAPIMVTSARPPRHEHASPKPPPLPVTRQASPLRAPLSKTASRQKAPSHVEKKRIELFRRHRRQQSETSPSRSDGRSGSAPAVSGGRPPLAATSSSLPPASAAMTTGDSANSEHARAPTTVTKGVPQLFFGKRDSSPSCPPQGRSNITNLRLRSSSSSSVAAQHQQQQQRPPRFESAAANSHNGIPSREKDDRRHPTTLHLSAVQLRETSPAALLPSKGSATPLDAAAVATATAALVGGGAAAGRSALSQHSSPSHYGSISSSINGGNSPSRTSLGRVRSSSKVKFLDQDGVVVSRGGSGSGVGGGDDGAGDHYNNNGGDVAGGGTTAVSAGQPTFLFPAFSAAAPSHHYGSGAAVKGRPLGVPAATAAAVKEVLHDPPPVPATAQVVIEQGRRTAIAAATAATAEAGLNQVEQSQRKTSPARQRAGAAGLRTSCETTTPPFSTTTASPLELPQVRDGPTVLVSPTFTAPQQQTSATTTRARPDASRARGDVPASPAVNDEMESLISEASTMPAGMLAYPQQSDCHAEASPTLSSQPQPQLQVVSQSPSQQVPFSTVSPYSSARRMVPHTASAAEASRPKHPSGIEVLRITRASGDVQFMPPPASASQHARDLEGQQVLDSTPRFGSGQLSGITGVRSSAMDGPRRVGREEEEEDYVAGAGDRITSTAAAAGAMTESRRGAGAHYGSNRSNHRFGSAVSGNRRVL